jgi:hypothetical protein
MFNSNNAGTTIHSAALPQQQNATQEGTWENTKHFKTVLTRIQLGF